MKITDMRVTDTIIDDSVETKGYNDSIVIDFKIGENEFKNILIQHDEYDDDYPAHQAAKEKGYYDSYEVYYEDDNSIKFRTFCEENNLDGTELLKEAGLDNLVLKELGVETEEQEQEQTKPTTISMADVLNGKASDTALKNQQDRQAEAGHRFFTKNSSDEKSKSH